MPPWSGSLFDWPDPPLSDRFLGRRWRVPVQSRGKGLTSWSGGKIRPVYGHSPASLPVRESLCSRAYVQVSVLDTAVAAPRRTVGPVRIPASHKRAFNDCLLGDDPFQPSGFRLVAQGGVGNGLNTPCAEWKGCLSRERRRRDDTSRYPQPYLRTASLGRQDRSGDRGQLRQGQQLSLSTRPALGTGGAKSGASGRFRHDDECRRTGGSQRVCP